MSSTINKIKDTVTPGHNTTHTTSTHTGATGTHAEGVHGPHSSRAANAADPRIDSDRDGGHLGQDTHRSTGTGVGHSTHTTGTGLGSSHTAGTGVGHSSTTTAGPHSSNLANKADPRVDSDRSGASHLGGGTGLGNTSHTQHTATSGLGNPGTYNGGHSTTGHSTTGHTTTAGPHSSNLANKADPRVDSDRSNVHSNTHSSGLTGTHAGNTHGTHTGTTGGISHSTNAGPHNSNVANKADPRVDSDLDGKGNRHGAHTGGILGASGSHATPGSGTAQNTAGPHNSDLLNKLDPRVDSDLSGGKTIGGNKTYQ